MHNTTGSGQKDLEKLETNKFLLFFLLAATFALLAALDENARTHLNELVIKFEVILADEVEKFKALEKRRKGRK